MAGAATEAGVAALDCDDDDDDDDDVVKWVSNFVPALDGQDKRMYFYLFASWSKKRPVNGEGKSSGYIELRKKRTIPIWK